MTSQGLGAGPVDGHARPEEQVLALLEEAAAVALWVQTLLPLDDVFAALKPAILALTRSTVHYLSAAPRSLAPTPVGAATSGMVQGLAAFLWALVRAVPYRIHHVLTGRGIHFSGASKTRRYGMAHPFAPVCREHDIKPRLTKPYHLWTNDQAGLMVCTLKETRVRVFHYATIPELRRRVANYLATYNFAKHLGALR